MTDFTDHTAVVRAIEQIQSDESDIRDWCREQQLFIHKKDGQWEPDILPDNTKPRYTFDMVEPLVDQVVGEIEKSEFGIKAIPASSTASENNAKIFGGMIRSIQALSHARETYNSAGRGFTECGLDGWEVVQDYADDDSFYQDLIIKRIDNFVDSVYFWPFCEPDASDAPAAVKLRAIPKAEYKEKYPKRNGDSLQVQRIASVFYQKPDHVIIGQLYYVKEVSAKLLLLSDGRVVEADEVAGVLDDLAAQGITVQKQRTRKKKIFYSRLLDAQGWINQPQETVFSRVPIIPVFGNFKILEEKVVYRGMVGKLIDPQRVYNYAKSREIEEGALAPREKIWMTPKQAQGHETQLKTLNTNTDPVQFFNSDPMYNNGGPPTKTNGANVNPGLKSISDDMGNMMRQTAGLYAASVGDNPNVQSGIAIERLQSRSTLGSSKYFNALATAIRATGDLLVRAIPRVYDTAREARMLDEDGKTAQRVMVNSTVVDEQTGQSVKINDLSLGKYDVICEAGPSFRNKQREVVQNITEIGTVDPSFIAIGSDILAKNMTGPEMGQLATRLRAKLFNEGAIPQEQMTEEEQAEMQRRAQQPPPPDPNMIIAEAEAGKSQAMQRKAEGETQALQQKGQLEQFKAVLQQQSQQFERAMRAFDARLKAQSQDADNLKTLIDGLKGIREGIGAEAIVVPEVAAAIAHQLTLIMKEQGTAALAPPTQQ